jgi:hypothetical protein
VGSLARVASQDPFWPGGGDRGALTGYFMKMGARSFVLQSLRRAWDEFETSQRRAASKARRKAQRQARKASRPKRKKKR